MADNRNLIPTERTSESVDRDPASDDVDRDAVSIVGVRLRDSSLVAFFEKDDLDLTVGMWVLVPTSRGQEPAKVVIAPDQIVLARIPESLSPIVGVRGVEDAQEFLAVRNNQILKREAVPPDNARLIGGLGKSSRSQVSSATDLNERSCEDEQYRRVKQSMPALGHRVITATGEGTVVALHVFKQLVTIRYDEPGGEETCHIRAIL